MPAGSAGPPVEPAGQTAPIPVHPLDALTAPAPAPAPASAAGGVAQPTTTGVEPCPHCGTALALDQRYCLECGAPRTYLSGMLLERLRSPAAPGSATQTPPGLAIEMPRPSAPGGPGGAFGTLPPSSGSAPWQRGNLLTLIAGVGVLLLAMGVGVLIGRSGGSSSSSTPAPQVITVGAAGTGAASTSTTPEETSSSAKSGAAAAAAAAAKHKAKAEETSSGVGSSPSKPAPPTVLKNLRGGSGQNYEQKSKNLPNVVSTG
jgi:hypothetical protein